MSGMQRWTPRCVSQDEPKLDGIFIRYLAVTESPPFNNAATWQGPGRGEQDMSGIQLKSGLGFMGSWTDGDCQNAMV